MKVLTAQLEAVGRLPDSSRVGCKISVHCEVGVGKLVEFYGDGDQSPFRGDRSVCGT